MNHTDNEKLETFDFSDAGLRSKQYKALHLCYDQLLDALPGCTNESSLAKCLETIRKDINAGNAPASASSRNSIADSAMRLDAINRLLKDLSYDE